MRPMPKWGTATFAVVTLRLGAFGGLANLVIGAFIWEGAETIEVKLDYRRLYSGRYDRLSAGQRMCSANSPRTFSTFGLITIWQYIEAGLLI